MPVDFEKLRASKKKPKQIDPIEIFRRLPKPTGINDLYTSQAEVLGGWFKRRSDKDVVVKLHTGGGKTLVGLLIAQSTINETGEPALYLVPTVQLVNQTLAKAQAHGILAVPYKRGQALDDDFVNGSAIMVATYNALFNGRSRFGLRGAANPQPVGVVILDDAHVAFSVIRDSFTLEITASDDRDRFQELTSLFRKAFKDTDRLGTFDDVVSGGELGVIEVPYWAWHEQLDAVRELLKADSESFGLVWPLLRDRLHLCHGLISKDTFTITPMLPLVDAFPTFSEASRRVYMSATIADDSEIIRTFDADSDLVKNALSSRSLAGVSERMILIPDLMPFQFNGRTSAKKLVSWVASNNLGAAVLVHSNKAAESWGDIATIANGSKEVDQLVADLQAGATFGPVVFANRYDGIDLPGNSCRLLVMEGLPRGTSDYEIFRASALYGGASITRMLAQRIEQGIGRGARGSGDHCVVLLLGSDLAGWIAKQTNFQFLTTATRAQLEMGSEISKEVSDLQDLASTILRSLNRDQGWIEYHAETLAELVEDDSRESDRLSQAAAERKALNLWRDGYHEKAMARLERYLKEATSIDTQTAGWLQQFSARIADQWGHKDRAQDLQRDAFSKNRNLVRPKALPPYQPLTLPGEQERSIARQIEGFRFRRGFMQSFEESVSLLVHESSANQFERALRDLAWKLGFSSERFDIGGEGPDVLWLFPNKVGWVIEAKSRKKEKNALTKEEHGQLLVASAWFEKHYPGYRCVRVSVHPKNLATKAAHADGTFALTYEKIQALVSNARTLLTQMCESQRSGDQLVQDCNRFLRDSNLNADRIAEAFLLPFETVD